VSPVFLVCCISIVHHFVPTSLYKKVHLPDEAGYVIPRVDNFTEEKSCVIMSEFPIGIFI
jgi:hypothetical protein